MFDVEKYAQHALQQRANGYKLFAENYSVISQIPVGGRVLDIGCGPGTVTQLLTNFTNLGEVFGADVDPAMIAEAKKRNRSSRLVFLVWDVQKPPTFDEKFDLVTANAMMHWIPDQHAALQNIYECLKPGGYFLAHFRAKSISISDQSKIPNLEKWKPHLNEARFNNLTKVKHPWQEAENPAEVYRKMIEGHHNFQVIRCEMRTMDNYYNELELDAHCELRAGNMLKSDTLTEKRIEFVEELKEWTRNKWDCISTESGNFYVHKNQRLVLVARKPDS